ncbi:MAG TPA: hypothetical protein VEV81_10335, partial [Pyrinomonadaceae bacterium]|nr:hypothetical protein [Pyrinomonadaceae bacterium]
LAAGFGKAATISYFLHALNSSWLLHRRLQVARGRIVSKCCACYRGKMNRMGAVQGPSQFNPTLIKK